MKHLSSADKNGTSDGQEAATNEPLALIAIQALNQGQRPLTPYTYGMRSAQDGVARA